MSDDAVDEGYTEYEDSVSFVGCTCDHDSSEHGWGQCEVEGCECEGGWEE